MQKRALIIDDDPAMAELIAEFCEDLGFITRCVTDSRQAVATATAWRPDFISLDLDMPPPNGIEILKDLRTHPATANTSIIVVSVLAKDIEGLRGHVRERLPKPVRFADFAGVVRRMTGSDPRA